MRFHRLSSLAAALGARGRGITTTTTTTTTTWRTIATTTTTTSSSLRDDQKWSTQRHHHQHQHQQRRRGYAASASSSSSSSSGSSSEPPGGGGGGGGSGKTPSTSTSTSTPQPTTAAEVAPGWGGGGGDDELDPDGSTRRALEIAIDRAGLYRTMEAAHGGGGDGDGPGSRPLHGLEAHLASIIKFRGGPITLAEYMQEVLTHPEFGYYMHRDVFGAGGDFITSPEISQVFGELMGVWAMCMWEQMGKPPAVRLVELGPGRGTLMGDLLRGTARFEAFTAALTVHMVEVSPKLRGIQRETLRCPPAEEEEEGSVGGSGDGDGDGKKGDGGGAAAAASGAAAAAKVYDSNEAGKYLAGIRVAANPMAHVNDVDGGGGGGADSNSGGGGGGGGSGGGGGAGSSPEDLGWDPVDRSVSGLNGRPVEWHETLDAVPSGPTILVAHEFFDAMPVHQFTRTERGWCERLVALRGQAPRRVASPADAAVAADSVDGKHAHAHAHAHAQQESAGAGAEKQKDKEEEEESALELVLSPGLTPAGALMIPRRLEGMPEEQKQSLRQLEISPRTLAIWERIAVRIEQHGGAAIAIDYGEEGPLGDTLLAIRDHKFCDVLTDPGSADLSAYVDFGAMRRVIEAREPSPGALFGGVECFGPVTQQELLISLGIGPRLGALVDGCSTQEEADRLIEGCTRLVSGDDAAGEGPGRGYVAEDGGEDDAAPTPTPPGMGIRYKAITMVSKGMGAPVGFQQ